MSQRTSRRTLLRTAAAGLLLDDLTRGLTFGSDSQPEVPAPTDSQRCFLTEAKDFEDVSRGKPLPYTLTGDALSNARLTPETWRVEIVGEDKAQVPKPLTIEKGNALDFAALIELGKSMAIRYFKALQCNNIAKPLGQGLWEGVALRDVLKLCGDYGNIRRVYYWGFHNDDPKQMFRSSLAMNQVLDTPPGEMPPMIAYRLNGAPIPLQRGGPVRMIVPWAHGFKSVKWLQNIVLTSHYEANDTYAEANNDPESYLKTAAYFDSGDQTFDAGPIRITGTAMVGWPGLERIEYWLRENPNPVKDLAADDPAWTTAQWLPAMIEPCPTNWARQVPDGVLPSGIWGFTKDGKPREWPMRYSVANWNVLLEKMKPGKYEMRVRSVDKNGFAQPEPRPGKRSGKNQVECKVISVK